MYMAENYNAPGSPYRSMKSFLLQEKGLALFSPGKFSAILTHSNAVLPKPGPEGQNEILCRATLSLAQLRPLKWGGSRMVPKRYFRGRTFGRKERCSDAHSVSRACKEKRETMKLIRTEDAAGQVLCHDITQIIPGEFKGARFRKGHIIQPEDIPVLLSLGKENLYVWEKRPGILHEDEAAALLYKAAAGKNIHGTEPKEGKIELIADCDGLLKINREALLAVNRTPQMMIATIHGDLPVKKGQKLAGTRIIPLVIEQEKMDAMQAAAGPEPILNVLPMQAKKFAVITTGSEVFKGRIEDKFTPILVGKLAEYGCEMTFHKVCDDDPAGITAAILEAKAAGCELIFTTGGMSVDPDDRTPLAIKNTGADIVTYGAPVLPGAMFLVSYLDGVPVCGLPGCVMYARRTIFDLLLPRLLADDPIIAEDIARLGEGGLCLGCAECHWPNCGFGHC